MKTSDILSKAKANIEDPNNWTQNAFIDEEGCMCSIGAIAMALKPDAEYGKIGIDVSKKAFYIARKNISRTVFYHTPFRSVAGFNDDARTTHQDIMEMFDQAIKVAKRKERIQSIKNFFKLGKTS